MSQKPTISDKQITLVRRSWEQLAHSTERLSKKFYDRLFEIDPDLEALFGSRAESTARQFMSMLNVTVNGLEQLDVLQDSLNELGELHCRLGIEREDFEAMGIALIDSIGAEMEQHMTPQIGDAWQAAYEVIVYLMMGDCSDSKQRTA